jgi:phosphate/sulfate permease
MPAGSPLGKLFGRSPVAPLQHHMQHVEEGVQLLCQLLQASVDGEVTRVDEIHALIESNAEAVRDLHRDIRRHLPRGLLLAMPRPDLLDVEIIAEYGPQFLGLACIAGFFMAWGIGANDVANAMGTSVGSRALTIRQAILIAMCSSFSAPTSPAARSRQTIRKGIIDPELLADTPQLLVYGMMSALFAAGTWLMIASVRGWPVSTTHSIVGAIVGFAAVGISVDAVSWGQVGTIAASWVVSPLLAGSISFGLFMSVKALILDTMTPSHAPSAHPVLHVDRRFHDSMVTLLKGLKHLGLSIDFGLGSRFANALPLAALVGLLVAIGGALLLRGIRYEVPNEDDRFASVERVFAVLMVFTACSMAFAHGSNDVANAVGPLAAWPASCSPAARSPPRRPCPAGSCSPVPWASSSVSPPTAGR